MNVAALVLEYLKTLVWPIVVIALALRYHRQFERLLHRFTDDAEEIEAKFLGLSAKFRKQIESAAQQDGRAAVASPKLYSSLARDQARVLADVFFSRPVDDRRRAAQEIQELAKHLELDTVLELSESALAGERLVGGIAIREHLQANPSLARRPEVLQAVRRGLADPVSRVRYRFIRAAGAQPELCSALRTSLEKVAENDEDQVVREEAERMLRVQSVPG